MDSGPIDPSLLAHAKVALAAFCGGMVRLLFKPTTSVLKGLWLLFGCITCGLYGTPAIMHWLKLDDEYSGAIGAVLGLIGLSLAEALLKTADNLDLTEWLRAKFGMAPRGNSE